MEIIGSNRNIDSRTATSILLVLAIAVFGSFFSPEFQDAIKRALDPSPQAADLVQQGVSRYQDGDVERALSLLDLALVKDPQSTRAHYWRGRIFHDEALLEEALFEYTQVIELDLRLPVAYYHRGRVYHTQGYLNLAIDDYTRAIALDPPFAADVYHQRGLANYLLGHMPAAIDDLTQAITIEPQRARAYYRRAQVHEALEDIPSAIIDYTEFLILHEAQDTFAAPARLRLESLSTSTPVPTSAPDTSLTPHLAVQPSEENADAPSDITLIYGNFSLSIFNDPPGERLDISGLELVARDFLLPVTAWEINEPSVLLDPFSAGSCLQAYDRIEIDPGAPLGCYVRVAVIDLPQSQHFWKTTDFDVRWRGTLLRRCPMATGPTRCEIWFP